MNAIYDVYNRIFEFMGIESRYIRKSGNRFIYEGPDEEKATKVIALIAADMPDLYWLDHNKEAGEQLISNFAQILENIQADMATK